MADGDVQYANPWSRWLFAGALGPLPPAGPGESLRARLLGRLERWSASPGELSQLPIDRPVFVLGVPRSGVSRVARLLCAHEQAAYATRAVLAYPGAPGTVERWRRTLRMEVRPQAGEAPGEGLGAIVDMSALLVRWFGRAPDALHWPLLRGEDLSAEQRARVDEEVRRLLRAFGGLGRRWVAPSTLLHTELLLLQDLFPDAHFIHVVRDPRPTANALVQLYRACNAEQQRQSPGAPERVPWPRLSALPGYVAEWGADDLRTAVHLWVDAVQEVDRVKGQLARFTELRYEDLLLQPRKELERLFSFAGMFWPEVGNTAFEQELALVGQAKPGGAYQDYALVESIARAAMERHGYR